METGRDVETLAREKLEGNGTGDDAYYAERLAQMNAGLPTWIVRNFGGNFEDTPGRVYDFYNKGRPAAFLEVAPEIDCIDVYIPAVRADHPEPTLVGSYDHLADAVAYVETNIS